MIYKITVEKFFKEIDPIFIEDNTDKIQIKKNSITVFSHWVVKIYQLDPSLSFLVDFANKVLAAKNALSKLEQAGGTHFSLLPPTILCSCNLDQIENISYTIGYSEENGFFESDFIEGTFYVQTKEKDGLWYIENMSKSNKVILNVSTEPTNNSSLNFSIKRFESIIDENTEDWLDLGEDIEQFLYNAKGNSSPHPEKSFNEFNNDEE